jgi:hypothetical protein
MPTSITRHTRRRSRRGKAFSDGEKFSFMIFYGVIVRHLAGRFASVIYYLLEFMSFLIRTLFVHIYNILNFAVYDPYVRMR